MQILCLANSWKEGGRCLAGIEISTGRWIRPISDSTHGQLNSNLLSIVDGNIRREIRALDVIEIGDLERRPEVGQPENYLMRSNQIFIVSKVESHFLNSFVENRDFLLYGRTGMVNVVDAPHVTSSLTLIRVENPEFRLNPNNSRQLRVKFTLAEIGYDLPVTDAAPWVDSAKLNPAKYSTGTWFFTVSLGVPFNKLMYKLVACGVPLNPNQLSESDLDEPPF